MTTANMFWVVVSDAQEGEHAERLRYYTGTDFIDRPQGARTYEYNSAKSLIDNRIVSGLHSVRPVRRA